MSTNGSAAARRLADAVVLELSQVARAADVPAPLVIPSQAGELLWSEGDLAFALS